MNTELEGVKYENGDLKHDLRILNNRLDLAHSENIRLVVKCEDLEKQLRISEYWLKFERDNASEAKLD